MYVLPLDWASSVLLLITAPVIPILMVLVGSYAEEHMQRQWTALSRLGASFVDALQGLPTLKVFGRSAEEREKMSATSEEFRERTMKVLRYAFISGFVLEFMTAMAIALVAVSLGVRLVSGDMPFEVAFLVLLLAPEYYKPLRELGIHRHAGMEGKPRPSASSRSWRPTLRLAPHQRLRPAFGWADGRVLRCRLRLPGRRTRSALWPIDHHASWDPDCPRRAQRSGKSTLVNLLLRFLEPDSGKIATNGIPIGQMPPETWRERSAGAAAAPLLLWERA